MLIDFFLHLKSRKLPVSTREYLDRMALVRTSKVVGSRPFFSKRYRHPALYFARTALIAGLKGAERYGPWSRLWRRIQVPDLIAYISQVLTFEPGDLIFTGTPPGVGLGQKPEPVYLRAGQVMRLGIDGLGIDVDLLELQVAADLLDNFRHGVFVVDLAPIHDPALVASVIAQTLSIREQGGQPILYALKDYLREKHLLLLLGRREPFLDRHRDLQDHHLRTAPTDELDGRLLAVGLGDLRRFETMLQQPPDHLAPLVT